MKVHQSIKKTELEEEAWILVLTQLLTVDVNWCLLQMSFPENGHVCLLTVFFISLKQGLPNTDPLEVMCLTYISSKKNPS